MNFVHAGSIISLYQTFRKISEVHSEIRRFHDRHPADLDVVSQPAYVAISFSVFCRVIVSSWPQLPIQKLIFSCLISFNDTCHRGVRTKHEHKHAHDHDNAVLKENKQRYAPVAFWSQSEDMNEDWKDNSKGCAADGADKRDKVVQLRYTDCQEACNEIKTQITDLWTLLVLFASVSKRVLLWQRTYVFHLQISRLWQSVTGKSVMSKFKSFAIVLS